MHLNLMGFFVLQNDKFYYNNYSIHSEHKGSHYTCNLYGTRQLS